MSIVNGTVRIEASQPFVIERLRKGFRTEIEAVIAEVLGVSVPVEFRVAPCSSISAEKMSKADNSSSGEEGSPSSNATRSDASEEQAVAHSSGSATRQEISRAD